MWADGKHSGTRLERRTGEGESPVCEMRVRRLLEYPSRPGHEESRLNLGGPSSLSPHLGTLADDLGSFPLANGHYRPYTDSQDSSLRYSEFAWGR